MQLCISWQDFDWRSASRGPFAVAELLVAVLTSCSQFTKHPTADFLYRTSRDRRAWSIFGSCTSQLITLWCHNRWTHGAKYNMMPLLPLCRHHGGRKNHEILWCTLLLLVTVTTTNKKLSYRRGTARCVVSIEILPIATQQCRNCLFDKSWPNRWYEVGDLVGGNAW